MADELYSRPLSQEARGALVDFLEAYIESMKTQRADWRAEEAKGKGIKLLQTDIDILVFVTTIATMHSPAGVQLLYSAVGGGKLARDIAIAIVRIMEEGIRRDKQIRTS